MTKKFFALVMALVLLMGCFSACGGKTDSEVPKEPDSSAEEPGVETRDINGLTLPFCEEKEELNILMVYDSQLVEDLNEIAGIQAMEEATHVHVNWMTYTQAEMPEKFQQLLATGEYFDIMFPGGVESYPGGYEQGIEDGVLVDMDEYIHQYMPNYLGLLESNTEAMKQATYDDGKLHAVRVIHGTDEGVKHPGAIMGPAYRADILKEMDEEVPETIDELHDLLVKCRDRGMAAPTTLQADGGTTLSLAWGVNTDWSTEFWQYDSKTGKVCFAPFAERWDDWLDTMRDWYAEGLIDKNFTVGSPLLSGDYSNFENDETMFIDYWFYHIMGNELYKQGYISNEDIDIQPVAGIVLNKGDDPIKCAGDACVQQEIFVAAQAIDKIDIISKWLDYQYTKEGIDYRYYGIEGESYTVDENGNYAFTDAILNDPNGLSISDALGKYAVRNYCGFQSHSAEDAVTIATASESAVSGIESVQIWASPEVTIHVPSGVSLNKEEKDFCSKYMTDIITLLEERMVKYILGTDTSPHEEFRDKLREFHIEECTQYYQDACDRYNAR